MRVIVLFTVIFLLFSCNPSEDLQAGELSVEWKLLENELTPRSSHKAAFILRNHTMKEIEEGWKLYFNTIFVSVSPEVSDDRFQIRHLAGDFFVLEGRGQKTPMIREGEKLEVTYASNNPFLKNSHAPEGLIFQERDGTFQEVSSYEKSALELKELIAVFGSTEVFIPTAEAIYEMNEEVFLLDKEHVPPFLPIPKSWEYLGEPLLIKNAGIGVLGDKAFEKAAKMVTKQIQLGYKPENDRSIKPLQIRIAKKEGIPSEGYHLEIRDRRVLILASDERGAFYGVQSFLALLPPGFWEQPSNEILLPQIEIDDAPDFGYRGLFLDVARNFIPKESIFKILDLMSFYKLNTFHFNLANDEGWRIEIKGLSELTDFGSKRGFSIDESTMLWPFYGSGAATNNGLGSGFYSVADFQEILRYADERMIEVIPEIGVPAHSRAAIRAMEKRYQHWIGKGNEEEANRYRLADPQDSSTYLSAQNFRDNTIAVCRESVYDFYEKVVSEIKSIYDEAGVPLKTWHTGGDEIPSGVWESSPLCDSFLVDQSHSSQHSLEKYFRLRVSEILAKYGLNTAGWEEIGLEEEEGEVVPVKKYATKGWSLYAWNAVPGWGSEDRAYKLANAGYPVVISSSANFYFDLAYNWDPREPGHTWSGVADMYQAWKAVPHKMYLSHDQTIDGKTWPWEEKQIDFEKLTEQGKKNILGVQGQLWTETIRSVEMVEYYLFPKMLGLVERAWNGDPEWSEAAEVKDMLKKRGQEWNIFSNVVGQNELPRLATIFGGVNARVPAPGLKKIAQEIWANVENPGLEIRWTDDGTVPSYKSKLYTEPLSYRPGLRFRAFNKKGKGGHVSMMEE
ncbi:hexosaminidase [Algoriphagus faecimaris]|uniref:beta-N-acetylhexosaminidase n=1 Tax=Algoriphagus faecimaris TaxID=686796 RepID=A0A1G6RN73_9BACT|nr:family 20 glycosylhydrolase [Algoriphagus faecimaris]SDD05843.1 hexosaminidase [Algoriphagus faecimaris]